MNTRLFVHWTILVSCCQLLSVSCVRVGFGLPPTTDSSGDGAVTGDAVTEHGGQRDTGIDDQGLDLPPAFTPLVLPAGGTLDDIAIHPDQPSTLYVFSAGGRVFRSTNRGDSWTECGRPPSRDIDTIAVAADETIYVDMWDDVYASRDQCASWQPTGGPPETKSLLVTTTGDLFAAADQGLWRLRQTVWSKVSVPTGDAPLTALSADASGEVILVGSKAEGLLRSQDSGDSWTRVNSGFPLGKEVHQILVDPEDANRIFVAARRGLYRSKNGGASWELIRDGDAYTVALQGNLLLMEGPGGIFESSNGGDSFATEDRRGAEMAKSRSRLLFAPDVAGRLYAAGGRGLFTIVVPSSGSWLWESRHEGIRAWSVFGIAQQASPPTLHLGTSAGVLRSDDLGLSWSVKGEFSSYSLVNDCAVDPAHPSVLLVAGNDLLRSEDQGLSFEILLTAGVNDYWSYQSIAFYQERTIIGSQERVLFYSPGDETIDFQVIERLAQDLLVVEEQASPLLLVATDDGLHSVKLTSPYQVEMTPLAGDVRAIVRDPAGTFFAGTTNGVRQATAIHETWQPGGLEQFRIQDLLLVQDLLIAATDQGIYTRKLDKLDWQEIPELKGLPISRLALDHQGLLLVGTIGFNLYRGALSR